jgi:putative nucleotidyltransferase with HDIG domain
MFLLANGVVLVVVLVALFTVQTGSTPTRVGEVAGETVVAQRQVTYADRLATQLKRARVADGVPLAFHFDPSAAVASTRQAAAFLAAAGRLFSHTRSITRRAAALQAFIPADAPSAGLQSFYALALANLVSVEKRSLQLLQQAQNWRFTADQAPTIELSLLSSLPASVSQPARTAVGEVLATFLTATQRPDTAKTNRLRKAAAARVPTQYSTIYAGQVIVRRGDLVTPTVLQELNALGLEGRGSNWRDILASLVFASAIVAMLFWYLHAFQPAVTTNARFLFLIDAGIVAAVAAARIFTPGHVILPFMIPMAAISTFAAVLIAPEACVALALALAILAGWAVANSFELTVFYFLTGAAGVLAIRQLHRLKQFMIAGVLITVFGVGVTLAFGLLGESYDFVAFRELVLGAAFNGFVSSALALGAFALLSSYFGVTTSLHLFELSQPNQVLLRRLTARAPGTYNHSLVVSSMVEQAAERIGANSLVAKISALYHDVGKTANPHCFVENQVGIANIHDELRPEESARIIRGHVSQGLRLARQHKLPRPVLDGIAEHHGTMPLAFFLHKAQQEADGEPIETSLYYYPGPKPQTKETGLLMLADGCESAVRAATDHSQARIEEIIRHIFAERIEQHQLDESPLTLQDLEIARSAFCSVLIGLYHPRIEYPEPAELTPEPTLITTVRERRRPRRRG